MKLELRGITKAFGPLVANDHIDLTVEPGQIHALLGENGAGKSTLMNVLYGLHQPDAGEILIDDEPVTFSGPGDAVAAGIGMVHQHFMLVPVFTVAESVALGYEPVGSLGLINTGAAAAKVTEISRRFGFDVDPHALIEDLPVGVQQRVEIIKALARDAKVLILDEPTAVLTPQEIEQLVRIMRDLVDKCKTIIIITHKLKEIMASADACTIIRRGVYMGTVDVSETTEEELASKMVGRHVSLTVEKTPAKPGEFVLSISDLHVNDERGIPAVKGLSLGVRAGEIVGIAGIDGNGQQQLVDAIENLAKVESGTIEVKGTRIENKDPRTTIDAGVSTIPADRQRWGLVLPFTVAENLVLERHDEDEFGRGARLDLAAVRTFARGLIEEYDIRPAGCEDQVAAGLSGGNQQKVIIAREVSNEPDLLMAFQPTRGLDVGAIEFVHKALIRERDRGTAILLVSLELDEVMDVSDTIAVIHDGQIVGTFEQGSVTEKQVGLLMAGGGAK